VCLFLIPHVAFVERFSAYRPLTFDVQTIVRKLTIDPPSTHFWFVRDLIVLVALAPLYHLVYRRNWLAGIMLVGLAVCWRPVDRSILSSEGLLFFFAGGWAGFRRLNLCHLRSESSWVTWALCALWLGLCVCQTCGLPVGIWGRLVPKVSTSLGVGVLWLLADRLDSLSIRSQLLCVAPYSFFIYASHAPMVRYIYKVLLLLKPEGSYYGFFVYLVTPAITVTVSVCAAKCIRQYGPSVYSVLTGGRVPPRDGECQRAAEATTRPA